MGDYNKLSGIMVVPLPDQRELTLSRQVTNDIKARFEDWLEACALRRLFAVKDMLEPLQFQEALANVHAGASAALAWGGQAWRDAIHDLPGQIKMLCLLAEEADVQQGIDEEKALEMVTGDPKVRDMVLGAVNEIMTSMPKANFLAPPRRGAVMRR